VSPDAAASKKGGVEVTYDQERGQQGPEKKKGAGCRGVGMKISRFKGARRTEATGKGLRGAADLLRHVSDHLKYI